MNWLAALGLAAFALGVGTMVAPGLLPVPVDRAFLSVLGVLALLQTYGVVVSRLRTRRHRTATPDPEVRRATPVPGEDGPDAIEGAFGGHWYVRRNEIREAAVAVLRRYAGLAEPTARARVADGSWTDDPVAAAHLSEDAPPVPVAHRLSRLLARESSYRHGRRRAIDAIAERAGVAPSRASGGGRRRRADPDDRPDLAPVDGEGRPRSATGHWRGVSAVALLAVGVGILAEAAPVVVAGVVGVGFAAYARAAPAPPLALTVERTLSADRAEPGEAVEVTLAVRNASGRHLPDLRLVDGVPDGLAVASGSPRLGTTLRPGETATLTYQVEAARGVHEFGPTTVLGRDVAGAGEAGRRIQTSSTLTCVPTLRPTPSPVPLRRAATQYAGRVRTPSGGEGVEFHATRAYQPGDPTNRIDWNRRARTGELATIEFREERAATVVLAVDARPPCFAAPEPHAPHAVDRSVEAAGRLFASLSASGNRVGIAAFGTDCWLAPGTGADHRHRVRDLLATHPGLAPPPGPARASSGWQRRLERRLPTDAQLLVLTPLCDAGSARLVRTFDASGYPAAVVSPDPTAADGDGPLLARVARRLRVTDLRRAGVPVVDWAGGESLDVALARAGRRRSA